MNTLIENQKLSSVNYKDFETEELKCYIYIVNGFNANRCQTEVEHTFKVGKTFSRNPISGRIKAYRKLGDINIVRLFRFENISSDDELRSIETNIIKFCENPSYFVSANFVMNRRSEWFNGDVNIVSDFVKNEHKVLEESQDYIKILVLKEKIKDVLGIWDENNNQKFYVPMQEENFVEDIRNICQSYKINVNDVDGKYIIILLLYLLFKLFESFADGFFTSFNGIFLFGDNELNKITYVEMCLNGYDCMSNVLGNMKIAYEDIYNKIRNGNDFFSSNQLQERLFYFSSCEMFQNLVKYHVKNTEHGNQFRNMIIDMMDFDRPIEFSINFEQTCLALTQPEKLGFEDKADYVGYYIDKYFHKKMDIKRQTLCPNRLRANHISSQEPNNTQDNLTLNCEDIYLRYLHKYNHDVCVNTQTDYFSSAIEPPFEEVSILEYNTRVDEQFCSKVFDYIKNMFENNVEYPLIVENKNVCVERIPYLIEETDDIVPVEEKVNEEKDDDTSLMEESSDDGECVACNGSGISYWSDGIYGECMECDSGQVNSEHEEEPKNTRRLLSLR